MRATAAKTPDVAPAQRHARAATLTQGAKRAALTASPLGQNSVRRKACACGGGCPRCGQTGSALGPKLEVSRPGDAHEREADRAADEVLRRKEAAPRASRVGAQVSAGSGARVEGVRRGGGEPLPAQVRDFFEPRFGRDFGGVRVHSDARAAESARALDAQAYTIGREVVFDAGRYAPGTPKGLRLLAHELAHVAQNDAAGASVPHRVSRAPNDPPKSADPPTKTATPAPAASPTTDPTKTATPAAAAAEPERPPGKLTWNAKDLLVYPLFVDIFSDIILKKGLTESERKQFKLKGYESAALFTWASAAVLGSAGAGGASFDESFFKNLGTWYNYTEALQPLTPHKDVLMDGLSTIVRLRVDDYLASDLFTTRLKTHALSLGTIALLGQGIYSAVQANTKPDPEDEGKLVTAGWAKHTGLGMWVVNKILKEETKAPDFFDFGPLQVKTHPGFSVSPLVGGKPPEGLVAEHSEGQGEGEGGQHYKFGGTLNLPKLVHKFSSNKEVSAEDMNDLQKYRGWQTSLWFNYERLDPTKTMESAGTLTDETFKGGALFGSGGFLFKLEAGARYDGEKARELTSFMINGGFGYSGKKGSALKRIGFDVAAIGWKETDILAPVGAGGAPTGGVSSRYTPFLDLEFGKRHKFGVGAAVSLASGSLEGIAASDVRGNLSYTYVGDGGKDDLPQFKLDITGSYSRLDWWDPNSARLFGFMLKGSAGRFHAGFQVNTGAGDIGEGRAAQIGEGVERGPKQTQKALVPSSFIISAGLGF